MSIDAAPMRADPGWLIAVVEEGLVAVGADRHVEVEFEAPFDRRRRVLEAVVTGSDPHVLAAAAASTPGEADALVRELRSAGALAGDRLAESVATGIGLTAALLAATRGEKVSGHVWTADELLVLPAGIGPEASRRALRSFVAGLADDLRLRAYCYVATWGEPSAWGDLPSPERAAAGRDLAERLDPEMVLAIGLEDGRVESVAATRLEELGAHGTHRLGTVLALEDEALPGGAHLCAASYALPNLSRPRDGAERLGRGTAHDVETARMVARAEAAERYASGDAGSHQLMRARGRDLDSALDPAELFAFNARQLAAEDWHRRYDPDEPLLWVEGRGQDGLRRWVPAEAVFYPFEDPEPTVRLPLLTSSSGVAAHTGLPEATERAVCELIERDAFMWHWVQRVSRERIDPGSAPPALARYMEEIADAGFAAHLVNLTLDTKPVILAVLFGHGWIAAGASAQADATLAAGKALREAASIAFSAQRRGADPERVTAEDVATPRDHLQFHHDEPGILEDDAFLVSSHETIPLSDVRGRPEPAVEAVSAIAEPLVIDLSSPATAPFRVVRSLVPGIVPISFGYDREPLGLPRLGGPITTTQGRRLGRELALAEAGPITPHPFA